VRVCNEKHTRLKNASSCNIVTILEAFAALELTFSVMLSRDRTSFGLRRVSEIVWDRSRGRNDSAVEKEITGRLELC
jgi:hypothetical protein